MAPARQTADCREGQIDPMHRKGEAETYPKSLPAGRNCYEGWIVFLAGTDGGIPHLL